MQKMDKFSKGAGTVLIAISILSIYSDLSVLITYWEGFCTQEHAFLLKKHLMFNVFRYAVLFAAGIGLLFKNVWGLILSQTFLFLSLYYLIINETRNNLIFKHFGFNRIIAVIIVFLIIVGAILYLNRSSFKEYFGLYRYKKIWLWSAILVLNVIGVLIHNRA